MPDAAARFVTGVGHGWIGKKPDLHLRIVQAWFQERDLPSELLPETTPWDRSAVQRLLMG